MSQKINRNQNTLGTRRDIRTLAMVLWGKNYGTMGKKLWYYGKKTMVLWGKNPMVLWEKNYGTMGKKTMVLWENNYGAMEKQLW